MQLRAHKLSIENFLAQLKGEPTRLSQPFAPSLPRMTPAALMLVSFLLLFSARVISPKNR